MVSHEDSSLVPSTRAVGEPSVPERGAASLPSTIPAADPAIITACLPFVVGAAHGGGSFGGVTDRGRADSGITETCTEY